MKYFYFVLINSFLVNSTIALLFQLNNSGNPFPFNVLSITIPVATLIITLQYPILNLRNNWKYKTFVFYLSMIVFLFIFGTVFDMKYNNIPTALKNGLLMVFLGQLFGGIIGMLPILFVNYLLQDFLFPKKTD